VSRASICAAILTSGLTASAHAEAFAIQGQQPSLQGTGQPASMQAPPTSAPSGAADAPLEVSMTTPEFRSPEPMGGQDATEDALRSDLPGLSLRIPGAKSEVRAYGFANLNGYRDFNARNQTDVPTAQTIPLAASPAAAQGGDFGFSARFSRIGIDTRTATGWGTLETRFEGDFSGGTPGALGQFFNLRQAWAELGTDSFRVLVGQANSLWNDAVYETLNFATNLNQSFLRQPQLRVTASLGLGLSGELSLEFPNTQFTSTAGVFTPTSAPSPSPAFNMLPDLLGRLTYRNGAMVLDLRSVVRALSMRTAGTILAPPTVTRNEAGWGVAGTARFPMRYFSWTIFGPDEVIGMAYYGAGIGRYFGGNTSGQDALSSIDVSGSSFDPLTTYGVSAAYRRFWTTQLRSNVVYSVAWMEYPTYALMFSPGSISATSLNSNLQQVIVNIIWSPFSNLRSNSTVGTGWLDVGLEYVYTHRDVFGGNAATGNAGLGYGIANRIYFSVTMRF